jgi:mannose-6-phosphate isomerase-like protein (cupin superfamily)
MAVITLTIIILDIVKRSARKKMKPLEYWRNENNIEGSDDYVKETVVEPPSQKDGKVQDAVVHPKTKQAKLNVNPNPLVEIVDFDTKKTRKERVLTNAPKLKEFKSIVSSSYMMYKGLVDPTDPSFYSGFIHFPPDSEKVFRDSGVVSMMFMVVEGEITVTINRTSFNVGKDCTFIVPRGNQYKMTNSSGVECRLFFVNNRKSELEPTYQ